MSRALRGALGPRIPTGGAPLVVLLVAAVLGAVLLVPERPVPASEEPAGAFPSPPGTDRAVIWAVGDGAEDGAESRAVARLISAGDPLRFLYLGDVYDDGSAVEFDREYAPVYGALKDITLPTPGNHEWPRRAEGYDPYWSELTGRRPPGHYAVRLAGWEILSLNSESPHGEGSEQLEWLRERLSRGGDCRIAIWHRPRYNAGVHGDQADLSPLWDALRGRARLVLNGHEHNMQRLREIDGITTLIAGAGGNGRYELDADDDRLTWSNAGDDGALRLVLSPGRARFEFRSTSGAILDASSAECTPAEK